MSTQVEEIVAALDALLEPGAFSDFGPNGLQVPASPGREVDLVATAVSATAAVHERAAELGAQLVLVHHGLFWRGMAQEVDRALWRRLRPLLLADVALVAYHLPLDAHLGVGNNALLAQALGAAPDAVERFAEVGVLARVDLSSAELMERTRAATGGREPLHLAFATERVRTVAVVTGGGSSYLGAAVAAGADALVTGEPTERVFAQAREAGVHLLAAGHHATETSGVRALGDELARRFGLRHEFLDEPNPI